MRKEKEKTQRKKQKVNSQFDAENAETTKTRLKKKYERGNEQILKKNFYRNTPTTLSPAMATNEPFLFFFFFFYRERETGTETLTQHRPQ